MNSIFKSDKRDDALERLALGITLAAKNCAIVITNISTLCQKPEYYSDPTELVNKWSEYLFTNHFHDFVEECTSPIIASLDNAEEVANSFFKYLSSLTPFFYENKKIISRDIPKTQKYKWSTDDYKELKVKLLYKWFYKDWDNWDGETRLKLGYRLELDTQIILKSIAASSKANSSIWDKQKKIDEIVFSSDLRLMINKVMPPYLHQYQKDLFSKYTNDFISRLPAAFKHFDDNFYEVGTYLYKYFQWSST